MPSKTCRDCNEDKPIADYRPPRSPRCLPCLQAKRQRDYEKRGGKEYIYSHNLRQYGLTVDEYRAKLAAQDGRCAICGEEPPRGKRLNVDHNHETGATRDLLCRWCNYALGNARDDPFRLRAMAEYLERHQANISAE
ncbi:endonuclease VII domain-containing protein [Streptomyces cavourensis]